MPNWWDPANSDTADASGRPPGVSDFDWGAQGVPFDLFGSAARTQSARENAREQQNRGLLVGLAGTMPTAGDLSTNYGQIGTTDEYGNLIGGPSSVSGVGAGMGDEQSAMRALQQLSQNGGYTQADRAAQMAMQAQNAQQVGSMNQAALQQAYGRGMGGGGAMLGAQFSGAQGLANANQQGDAQIQQAAMQRALQSLTAQGQLGGSMNQQQLARQQALDAYNQAQLGWRRQRSAVNVGLQGETNQSKAQANQQAYNNRSNLANQFIGASQNNAQNQQQNYQNQQQSNANAGNAAGSALTALASL